MMIGALTAGINPAVFYLNGHNINSKKTFLKQIAISMKFPDYFGNNWDALNECLTDLSWIDATRYILVWAAPEVFSMASEVDFKTTIDILENVKDSWLRDKIHFDVLFISEVPQHD